MFRLQGFIVWASLIAKFKYISFLLVLHSDLGAAFVPFLCNLKYCFSMKVFVSHRGKKKIGELHLSSIACSRYNNNFVSFVLQDCT